MDGGAVGRNMRCLCIGVEKEREEAAGREAASEKAAKGISSAGGTAGFADWIRNDNPPGMGTYFVDGREKVRGSQTHLFQAEMQITYQEMQKGCGEKEAYERFGQRIGMTEYRRLSSLLARNLEKGTRNLCDLLSAESQEAWENRKFQAKKLGEEAGMKLLFPMLLLFVLILIILRYPAINKF